MFCGEGFAMLTCPSDGWRRVRVVELPQYLPRSVVRKMVFKSPYQDKNVHSFTEEMYQALLPCRAHFAVDAVCDFHSFSHPDTIHKAFTEVFMCRTSTSTSGNTLTLTAHRVAAWHACVSAGVKRLSIGEIHYLYWDTFLCPFIAAIEQQFIQATSPTSFNVDLLFFVGMNPAPNLGTTRELENIDTNEQLKVIVDADVRKPSGERAFKTKVTIQRKPTT
ncbi:hypothetical protein AAVH_30873 [Aphelenchoides avenae]|nr:hypothetical protein AAVH_30873 [Aphelenchus avenae]